MVTLQLVAMGCTVWKATVPESMASVHSPRLIYSIIFTTLTYMVYPWFWQVLEVGVEVPMVETKKPLAMASAI